MEKDKGLATPILDRAVKEIIIADMASGLVRKDIELEGLIDKIINDEYIWGEFNNALLNIYREQGVIIE